MKLDLNLRQRKWFEFIKDHNLRIHYYPSKANLLADALSRKLHCISVSIEANQPALHEEFQKCNLEVVEEGYATALALQPTLESHIKVAQLEDQAIVEIKRYLQDDRKSEFTKNASGMVMHGQQLHVLDNHNIKELILR